MVYETDRELNFTYVNQKALELFGYTLKEFYGGLNASKLLTEEHSHLMIQRTFNDTENSDDKFTDFQFKRKNGSTFWGWINGKAIEKNGKLIGFRGIVVDISMLRKK